MSKSHFLIQLRKPESAPTVMYCIPDFHSYRRTKNFPLERTPITHWIFCCSHVGYKVGTGKKKREGNLRVDRSAACVDGNQYFLKDSSFEHDVDQQFTKYFHQNKSPKDLNVLFFTKSYLARTSG